MAKIYLNSDNDESREVVDFCIKQRKTLVNPIIDWEDDDVWEFIEENNLPYCSLYDEGFKRLGCIGCPLAGGKEMKRAFERWPQYKKLYIDAFDRMLKMKSYERWRTGEDVFNWWIRDKNDPR